MEANKEIDFENGKISTLFKKLLIPTLLGSLAISAVTTVDGIFIGQSVGTKGVAAVNIVVPIYQILSGLGLMIGVGCSVVSSILLSKQNIEEARKNITQAIILSSTITCLLILGVLIFPQETGELLGASPTLMPYVLDYLKWIMPCFLFEMWSLIGLFIIRLDGSAKYAMWCNVIPALLNVFLDWLFIFPLGMGVKGAAIATSISTSVGGIMALIYLLFFAQKLKLTPLKFNRKNLQESIKNVFHHCTIGFSTLLGELTLAILILCGNIVFMKYLGDNGVGAYGIASYYTPYFFMVGNSIAQSAQPIISYNYGIGRRKEINQAVKLLLTTAAGIGIIISLLFILIPDKLIMLFLEVDSPTGQIALEGFPYFAIGILFYILNVAIIGYYQSIESVKKSTFYVILRGFILLIPAFIILPKLLGIKGIWLAMPSAEILTTLTILTTIIISRHKSAP